MSIRLRLSEKEHQIILAERGQLTTTSSTTPLYGDGSLEESNFSAVNAGKLMNIEEYCAFHNLNIKNVKSYKLISHTTKPSYNIVFYTQEESVLKENFSEKLDTIIKKYITQHPYCYRPTSESEFVTRAVFTDQHIGMCVNEDGNSLYGGVWDKKELLERAQEFSQSIISSARTHNSNILYLDSLGDMMDGWDAQTTRGGHPLPQNMTNAESFDTALEFITSIVDNLVLSYQFSKIYINSVSNSNHGGDFELITNNALEKIFKAKYPEQVEYRVMKKFIEHYFVGNHCFILCHGKDDKALKFGFKPILDANAKDKIDQYIKHHDISRNCRYIEFSKGDSHQFLLDFTTSDDFDYMSYLAFSPASEWVQTNFKKGKSGFVIQSFDPKKQEKQIEYKYFKWKTR